MKQETIVLLALVQEIYSVLKSIIMIQRILIKNCSMVILAKPYGRQQAQIQQVIQLVKNIPIAMML